MADDLATVTDLLERWRDAGTIGRMGTIVDATRAIRSLPPERKRALAVEVAERVAPELVPRITAEEGDLSAQQVTALVDLLRRADREQLDDLVTALRTGDVAPALALADEALDALAPPSPDQLGTPDDDPSDGPDRARARAAAASAGAAGAAAGVASRLDGTVDDVLDALDDDPAETSTDDATPQPAPSGPDDDLPDLPAVPDEEELRAQARARAANAKDKWRDTSPPPATMEPLDINFDVSFALSEGELPDTSVEVVPTLLERETAEQDGEDAAQPGDDGRPDAEGFDRDAAGDPWGERASSTAARTGSDASDRVEAVLAQPDGYRRRRAAIAALDDGSLRSPDALAAVLDHLERSTDRSWVAGAALAAGVLHDADLDDLPLDPSARRRLRARLRRAAH